MPPLLNKVSHFLPILDNFGRELVDEISATQTLNKRKKGTVAVEVDKGWLRLRWNHGGKRYTLAMGLPDDAVNRSIAERKAAIIQMDLKTEQFDQTLNKYRLQV